MTNFIAENDLSIAVAELATPFGIKFYIICSSSADLFVPLFAGMSASLAVKGSRSI
jgi:hypothetical protein